MSGGIGSCPDNLVVVVFPTSRREPNAEAPRLSLRASPRSDNKGPALAEPPNSFPETDPSSLGLSFLQP